MWKLLHFLGFHKWQFVKQMGYNEYYECDICKKRDVEYLLGGYSPIDREWLNKNK